MNTFSSILIATFSPWKKGVRSPTNGMVEPMLSYFLPKFKTVWLLDQPYPSSDILLPFVEKYSHGKLKKKQVMWKFSFPFLPLLSFTNKPGTQPGHKIRDFLSVVETGLSSEKPFDFFVGMESINALAGVFLRKMGKVKIVAYYVSDYSPKRFQNNMLNRFYLWLDRMAAMHSDYIWDVSPAMQPARISAGLDPKKSAPVVLVPNALFKNQITYLPWNKREKHTVVFVGTLGLENGPDTAIKAFSLVIKQIPDAMLHIIGGGGQGFELEYLEKLTKKLKLEKHIVFHPFISDLKKLSELIKHYQVAIAPYKSIPGSTRLYGDATKLRLYLAVGLPIITTHVPPLGREIEKKGAAYVAGSSEKELAKAITEMLKNPEKRKQLVTKAVQIAKNNLWENTYKNAIKEMKRFMEQ